MKNLTAHHGPEPADEDMARALGSKLVTKSEV